MDEITKEDAEQIFYAVQVAEGEIGDEFKNLKAKLYRIFPEILIKHTETERQYKAESDRQQKARQDITEEFLKTVNPESPILEQVTTWFLAHTTEIRSHFSDEICFPFDIWKYANTNLVTKLAGETRIWLTTYGSDFERIYAIRSDKEMVHGLIRVLEAKSFEQRKKAKQ